MRKPRKGEFVCDCRAYAFPHRFLSGDCTGEYIAHETWERNYGGGICKTCSVHYNNQCDVVESSDGIRDGECFLEFVNYNGIKIYSRE